MCMTIPVPDRPPRYAQQRRPTRHLGSTKVLASTDSMRSRLRPQARTEIATNFNLHGMDTGSHSGSADSTQRRYRFAGRHNRPGRQPGIHALRHPISPDLGGNTWVQTDGTVGRRRVSNGCGVGHEDGDGLGAFDGLFSNRACAKRRRCGHGVWSGSVATAPPVIPSAPIVDNPDVCALDVTIGADTNPQIPSTPFCSARRRVLSLVQRTAR